MFVRKGLCGIETPKKKKKKKKKIQEIKFFF